MTLKNPAIVKRRRDSFSTPLTVKVILTKGASGAPYHLSNVEGDVIDISDDVGAKMIKDRIAVDYKEVNGEDAGAKAAKKKASAEAKAKAKADKEAAAKEADEAKAKAAPASEKATAKAPATAENAIKK
jgi:hypothetical protein